MAKRAIVLANGSVEDPVALRERLGSLGESEVIAVDGGSLHASSLGLAIDVLVGDLDSLRPDLAASLRESRTRLVQAPPMKDETDLELAVLEAVQRGAEEIIILGGAGGRLDMTLANVLLLLHSRLAGVRVELWHGWQTAMLISPPQGSIRGEVGDTLSLIPLAGDARGVTTSGLEYPLCGDLLVAGPARGISNVMTEPVATVQLREGHLLVVHTPGRA